MLSRSIVIISCISLLGVTVLPASLIPCCCKPGGMSLSAKMAAKCGATGKMMCGIPAKTKSCCAKDTSDQCSPQKTVKKNCPHCRCLEQMQIVTLTGHNDNEQTTRISALAAVETADTSVVGIEIASDLVFVKDFVSTPLSLQTCTLRC